MNSSNRNPHIAPSRSDFRIVIAFDYYDGPESGLAVYPSGEAVRFVSVGDSASRMQRGFEMEMIEGDWEPFIESLIQKEGLSTHQRIMVPDASEILASLRENVMRAITIKQFVAVGSPNLEHLLMVQVGEAQLSELRKLGCSPEGFRFARQLVGAKTRR